MKREQITVKTPDGFTVKVPAQLLASAVIAALIGKSGGVQLPAAQVAQPATEVPAIGEYWPDQGGHNAGLVAERNGVPAHYLIVAAKDIGNHEWGGRGKESVATSKFDGWENTAALSSEGGRPAATAATEYSADGHVDFYLPAAAELYHCWLNDPERFSKDCWYWSSTQRSANLAFFMYFDGGFQGNCDKLNELRVRPVRRLFI